MIGEKIASNKEISEMDWSSEINWINSVKYFIIADIRSAVDQYTLSEVSRQVKKLNSGIKKYYVRVLDELVDLKKRYADGDKSAKIRLQNYGFIRKKKDGNK